MIFSESDSDFAEYIMKICLIIIAAFAIVSYLWLASAVELSIVGQSVGDGIHSMQFAGECLNVSLMQNGTAWNISGAGQL